MDVHVRHGIAEDLVVEVARAEHRLDGSRGYGYRGPEGQGLLWAEQGGVGDVAATEYHHRVARRRGDPLEVSISVVDGKVANAVFVLVGTSVGAPWAGPGPPFALPSPPARSVRS